MLTNLQGSGNLGPAVVKALVDTGFIVTVLTRLESKATFSSEVKVQRTDYDSASSLEKALAGQDAVVSTVARAGVRGQTVLVDAAIAAGSRFRHGVDVESDGVCRSSGGDRHVSNVGVVNRRND